MNNLVIETEEYEKHPTISDQDLFWFNITFPLVTKLMPLRSHKQSKNNFLQQMPLNWFPQTFVMNSYEWSSKYYFIESCLKKDSASISRIFLYLHYNYLAASCVSSDRLSSFTSSSKLTISSRSGTNLQVLLGFHIIRHYLGVCI